jgi:uncharacterized damage-inducible protein DinB
MNVQDALLESWDRQCRIVQAVASRIDESNRHVKPSEDGWPLDLHLAHVHFVRRGWLSQFSPKHGEGLGKAAIDGKPLDSLDEIRGHLEASGKAVREAVREGLENGVGASGGYDHPVFFLQHMVWHEGWHVGLLFLGLRVAGQEPTDEWEEANVWGEWRVEEQ